MNQRQVRQAFFIVGEGIVRLGLDGGAEVVVPSAMQESTEFRFSRFVPGLKQGHHLSTNMLSKLAATMVGGRGRIDPSLPAGYVHLVQFAHHDQTLGPDPTDLMQPVALHDLLAQRAPSLDLGCVYGRGPDASPQWYDADGMHLRRGTPADVESPHAAAPGFDLPRWGADGANLPVPLPARRARIPDARNDTHLALAQLHTVFIRFHNRVVDQLLESPNPGTPQQVFTQARSLVTLHYQWMLRHDCLPKLVDPTVVDDVFRQGRRHFEPDPCGDVTLPVEFSAAVFRVEPSMAPEAYSWNRHFNPAAAQAHGPMRSAHVFRLLRFSGRGSLVPTALVPGSPADLADLEACTDPGDVLPSNWVADWTRLFDLRRFGPAFTPAPADMNWAMAVDTHIVDPYRNSGTAVHSATAEHDTLAQHNVAFRWLMRGRMLALPSGQQLAQALRVDPLDAPQIFRGNGGAELPYGLFSRTERYQLETNTPLWFYILREAEVNGRGRLAGVGATVVAETFHRAMQASRHSIVADSGFRPMLGPGAAQGRFDMADLLHVAFDGQAELLSPHTGPHTGAAV